MPPKFHKYFIEYNRLNWTFMLNSLMHLKTGIPTCTHVSMHTGHDLKSRHQHTDTHTHFQNIQPKSWRLWSWRRQWPKPNQIYMIHIEDVELATFITSTHNYNLHKHGVNSHFWTLQWTQRKRGCGAGDHACRIHTLCRQQLYTWNTNTALHPSWLQIHIDGWFSFWCIGDLEVHSNPKL